MICFWLKQINFAHELVNIEIGMAILEGMYGRITRRLIRALKYVTDVEGGVIDSEIRGKTSVILFNYSFVSFNCSSVPFNVEIGDRIA